MAVMMKTKKIASMHHVVQYTPRSSPSALAGAATIRVDMVNTYR